MIHVTPYSLNEGPDSMPLRSVIGRMYGEYNLRGPVFYPESAGMGALDQAAANMACCGSTDPCYTTTCRGPQVLLQGSPNGVFHVGDNWQPIIAGGTPLMGVYVVSTLNGVPQLPYGFYATGGGPTLGGQNLAGPVELGTSDNYGNWNMDSWMKGYVFQPIDVGTWKQTYYTGDTLIGSVAFTVLPNPNYRESQPTGSVAPNQEVLGNSLVPVTEQSYYAQEQSQIPITTSGGVPLVVPVTAPNQTVPPTTQLTQMPTNFQNTGTLLSAPAANTTPTATSGALSAADSSILGMSPTTLALVGGGALLLLMAMGGRR